MKESMCVRERNRSRYEESDLSMSQYRDPMRQKISMSQYRDSRRQEMISQYHNIEREDLNVTMSRLEEKGTNSLRMNEYQIPKGRRQTV